jgi:vancomycin permeability regulator SanA
MSYYSLRESLATLKALWELHITRPPPTFLGSFEGI